MGDLLKKAKTFMLSGIVLTLTSILIHTVAMSFNVYISKKIGAEALGIYHLILSIYMFGVTVAISGISLAATRVVSAEIARNNLSGAKTLIKKCVKFSFVYGSIAAGILVISSGYLVEVYFKHRISEMPLILIGLSLPFLAMSASINGYFLAVRRATKTAMAQVLEQGVKIFCATYFINLFMPKGLEGACLALVLGGFMSELVSFIYLYVLYTLDMKKHLKTIGVDYVKDAVYVKKIFRISLPVSLTSYIRSFLSMFKQLIIPLRLEKSGLTGSYALSSYGMVSGMVLPMILFPHVFIETFSSLLIPEFSNYFATKNKDKIRIVSKRILKTTLIFSIGVAGVFYCFSLDLCKSIYNNIEIVNYVRILAPLTVLIYLDAVIDCILKGIDEQVSVMLCNILDLVVSIFCIYFLLPIYGVNGYIMVIFISEILNCLVSTHTLLKKVELNLDIFRWVFLPIVSVLLSRFLVYMLDINLFLKIPIFLLVYLGILFVFRAISKEDFIL